MKSVPYTEERLIAARPPVAEQVDRLVGPDERAHLLEQILGDDTKALGRLGPRHGTRNRRRALATVGAAAALALLTTTAARVWPGQSSGNGKPVASSEAAVLLLAHVTSAVGSVNDVAVVNTVTDGVQSTIWTLTGDGSATRMRYSVDGHPDYDQTISTVNGLRTITNVDFAARAWWTETSPPVPGSPCATTFGTHASTGTPATAVPRPTGQTDQSPVSCQTFGPTPQQIMQNINAAVFNITGHPTLNGQPTIEITAYYPNTKGSYRLFVDPKTFLPLQSINSVNTAPFTTTYTYLPAIPANMALLEVPIPSGFRHVPQPIFCNPTQLGMHHSPFGCP